jgi:hypothetical protein
MSPMGKGPGVGPGDQGPPRPWGQGGLSLSRTHRGNRARPTGFPRCFVLTVVWRKSERLIRNGLPKNTRPSRFDLLSFEKDRRGFGGQALTQTLNQHTKNVGATGRFGCPSALGSRWWEATKQASQRSGEFGQLV